MLCFEGTLNFYRIRSDLLLLIAKLKYLVYIFLISITVNKHTPHVIVTCYVFFILSPCQALLILGSVIELYGPCCVKFDVFTCL